MAKVVHFEINADRPKRAIEFYEKVFGWKIKSWGGPMDYWLVDAGPKKAMGINGAIMKREDPKASVYITIGVKSLDESLKKILKNGGKQVTKKSPIPGIGYFAYVKDTEGNVIGILEPDMKAK